MVRMTLRQWRKAKIIFWAMPLVTRDHQLSPAQPVFLEPIGSFTVDIMRFAKMTGEEPICISLTAGGVPGNGSQVQGVSRPDQS